MSAAGHSERRAFRIDGVVQGVGFRPFVHRLACEEGLAGSVRNGGDGVHVELVGTRERIERFCWRLRHEAPPLARVDSLVESAVETSVARPPPPGFTIAASHGGEGRTGLVPDAALCADCRRELLDPGDRRFRYPFVNCTACGPRFSILRALPHDRANTTMASFALCDACRSEYEDVRARRFHAEPTACAVCGPRVWLERAGDATVRAEGADAIEAVQATLAAGGICAIKGIGGFHLACSARDEGAIVRLRGAKRRLRKPFAVMVRDLSVAGRHCALGDVERDALRSAAAPIVLLDRLARDDLPAELAPGLNRLGVMLPYSPLHALVVAAFDVPLVMTSGNVDGEPQVTGNACARETLAALVDVLLMHDRDIVNRVDDGVVQIVDDEVQVLRRARGHAPAPRALPPGLADDHPSVLAFGGDLKNAFALARDGKAVLSPHIGDLSRLSVESALQETLERFRTLLDFEPRLLAADTHPAYRSRALAAAMATARELPLTEVAHHHAHAAACMAEHALAIDHPDVLALVQDGIGHGDGELRGAELLACGYRAATRKATLEPAALAGGERAAREPWRNLVVRLDDAFGDADDWPVALRRRLDGHAVEIVSRAARAGLNAPPCSSAGRLFDALAAASGLCVARQEHEGDAAMRLQSAAEDWLAAHGAPGGYRFGTRLRDDGLRVVSPRPIWSAVAADLERGADAGEIAARFHVGWASVWCDVVRASRVSAGPVVVLSGGVFQNRLLAELVRSELTAGGLTVLEHREIPANDGGLGLGQALVALARHHDARARGRPRGAPGSP